MKEFIALVACLGIAAGIALAATPLAPSAVVAAASTYDTKTVTVSGTVKNVKTRNGPRGTITSFELCDTQCVNVVQFGSATITEGQTQTVTGQFRASLSRGQMTMQNVIMTGSPNMPGAPSMPSGMPKPTIQP
jgi:cytochrome c-type biogenesis protein CcmE